VRIEDAFVIHEQTTLHRHVHQRIFEPRHTVTAQAMGLAIERKNAAQVLVMTTKEEIQRRYDVLHTDLLQCATFSCTLRRLLIICSLHIWKMQMDSHCRFCLKLLTLFLIGNPRPVL